MKCPHCNSLCAEHQPTCLECRRPLTLDDEPSPQLPWRAATLFMALGLAISVAFIPHSFPSKSDGPINYERAACIALVSGVCGLTGYLIGSVVRRSRRAQMHATNSPGPH
jgi:hypothetical protein